LIDVLSDLDVPTIEMNSSKLFNAAVVHISFHSDPHGRPPSS